MNKDQLVQFPALLAPEDMLIPWERLNHQVNLQVHGLFVPDLEDYLDSRGVRMFREFRLQFSYGNESPDPVSMKLTAKPAATTPYIFKGGRLLFEDQELKFPDAQIYRVLIPAEERAWHFKGYTFPFRGSKNPYRELRLNLKISGYCPGRCLFCHRTHSHRIKNDHKYLPDPKDILAQVKLSEGDDVFSKISRIMFISELFGSEKHFLDVVQHTAEAIRNEGFSDNRDFNCCATDVRSLDGLKRLKDIVRTSRFCFSLEFFRNRDQWMGPYKGIPMKAVYPILENARRAGFEEIQLNYLAGIDSFEECEQGFLTLSRLGLVDSVGLSTFTLFAEDEAQMRLGEAWQANYYQELVAMLNACHIQAYRPDSYDMGCPYTYLMEKSE